MRKRYKVQCWRKHDTVRLVKATLIRQVRENDNATKRYKVQCWKHDIVRLVKAMLIRQVREDDNATKEKVRVNLRGQRVLLILM